MGHEEYSDHLNDPKKSGGPLCCTLICSGVLSYFFGVYWLNNPDQNPNSEFFSYITNKPEMFDNNQYDCFAITEANQAPERFRNEYTNNTLTNYAIREIVPETNTTAE